MISFSITFAQVDQPTTPTNEPAITDNAGKPDSITQDTSNMVKILRVRKDIWIEQNITYREDQGKAILKMGGGAVAGGGGGALIGSFICPGVGTLIGAYVGASLGGGAGAVASSEDKIREVTNHKVDGYQIDLNNGQTLRVKEKYKKGQRVPLESINVIAVIK